MSVTLHALLVLVVVAVVVVVPCVIALVDALRRPYDAWGRARQNKLVWVLVILFAGIVGAVLYLAIARPALGRAEAAGPGLPT